MIVLVFAPNRSMNSRPKHIEKNDSAFPPGLTKTPEIARICENKPSISRNCKQSSGLRVSWKEWELSNAALVLSSSWRSSLQTSVQWSLACKDRPNNCPSMNCMRHLRTLRLFCDGSCWTLQFVQSLSSFSNGGCPSHRTVGRLIDPGVKRTKRLDDEELEVSSWCGWVGRFQTANERVPPTHHLRHCSCTSKEFDSSRQRQFVIWR